MTSAAQGSGFPASPAVGDALLLIVDGHAYAYRAFHAIRELSASDGSPTNAIYGFVKMLGRMRAQVRPTHLVVIWDGGLAAERTASLPGYKAQRPPMPTALASQLDGIGEYLQAAGIASFCREGVEADDWIARVARGAVLAGARVVIASSDKDFMQLVTDRIGLLNPNDKTERIWTAAEVREKTGVEPEQIVDWLSLIGDSVDNIPGVPGVGPKTATALLQQFGSVERLYARLEEVASERVRRNLQAAQGAVLRNQQLVRLREDVGEPFLQASASPAREDTRRLLELYTRWGFRTLRQELEARSGPAQGEFL